MATNIYIGDMSNPLFIFDDDNIISLVTHTAVNFMPQELTADTADIQVEYDGDGAIQNMDWATSVTIYRDSQLSGKFYLTNVKRIGASRYEINTTSVIGLLEYETFYGQKYNNIKFKELVEDILLTNGFKYCRFYSTVHRGLFDDITDVSIGTNRFYPVKIQSSVNSYPMNSKIAVYFKLNKFIVNDLIYPSLDSATTCRVALWGNNPTSSIGQLTPEQASEIKSGCYGIYMDVIRPSVQDEWPDYGELFFIYEENTYSLGTPTEPTDYDVSVDPASGTAVINGVTYSITNNHPTKAVYALAWCCGGTIINNVSTYIYPILCDIEYGKYKLWDSNGTRLVDLVYTENPKTKAIQADNMPARLVSGTIDFSKFDRKASLFDGGASDWAYNCRDNISYGSNVDQLSVYGWIPSGTKRDALHQLLLATGVIMRKDNDGNVYFTSPTETYIIQLSSDKIYTDGSQENLEHTNRIEVTEHVFEAGESSSRETVFEDSGQHSGVYVALYQKQPVDGSLFEGLDVLSYNANGAIVMGAGTISAIPAKHTETVLHRDIGDSKDGRTVSISDATLVSLPNSESVLDRLEAYYGSVYVVENSIVLDDEKAGNLYSFTSPFYDQVTGYLAKISSTFSKITKAACRFICGYNPPEVGQDFSHWVILQNNGTWNVPGSVFDQDNPKIRVVLIGGGQGGSSGYAGANGEVTNMGPSSSNPAKGGVTGNPGSGGKIFTIDILNPSASYNYSCGVGGEGGAISYSHTVNNPGTFGGDTTFTDGTTSYSSASGESSEEGVTNFFNGAKYAKQVIYYADGGDGGYIDLDSGGLDPHIAPEEAKLGIVRGELSLYNGTYYHTYGGERGSNAGGSLIAYGGCGGGAALTNSTEVVTGGNGSDAIRNGSYYLAGNGGAGANAEFVPLPALSIKSTYWGYGGQGGAGGGGGGSSGTGSVGVNKGTGGQGGYGGVGGKGGNGCILIYY